MYASQHAARSNAARKIANPYFVLIGQASRGAGTMALGAKPTHPWIDSRNRTLHATCRRPWLSQHIVRAHNSVALQRTLEARSDRVQPLQRGSRRVELSARAGTPSVFPLKTHAERRGT